MPRNKFGVANSFTSSFMRGFSFVDDINHRRRSEARLEQEIARQRSRQDRQDAIAAEEREFVKDERAFALSERDRTLDRRRRLEEVSEIMADPNADLSLLDDYLDIPEVSAAVREGKTREQAAADIQLIMQGEDVQGSAPVEQPGAEQPSPGGLSNMVQESQLPSDLQPTPFHTQDDLQALSLQDPQAAMQIRDEQNEAERQAVGRQRDLRAPATGGRFAGFTGGAAQEPTEFEKAEGKKAAQRDAVGSTWKSFGDINDLAGDALRNSTPSQQVGLYFQDRNNIDDPRIQQNADMRIRPAVQQNIADQQAILANPAIDRNGLEARNAKRKLSQSIAIAKEINLEFKPLQQAGVDSRGLPIDGRNPELTDAAINAARSAPRSPVPQPVSSQRADATIVSRGTRGRVSERFAQAATRLFQNNRIDMTQLDSLLRTGRLPSTAPEVKVIKADPKENLFRIHADGRTEVVHWGTDPADETSGRNLISDDGLKEIKAIAAAMNGGDENIGDSVAQTFKNFISRNENRLSAHGYRFQNVNDVTDVYNRWMQTLGVQDAFNDEWWVGSDVAPDFQEHHGNVDEAFFKDLGAIVEENNLRVPGSTTFGLGGETPNTINALRPVDPGSLQSLREDFPEIFARLDDAQIQQWLADNGHL